MPDTQTTAQTRRQAALDEARTEAAAIDARLQAARDEKARLRAELVKITADTNTRLRALGEEIRNLVIEQADADAYVRDLTPRAPRKPRTVEPSGFGQSGTITVNGDTPEQTD